jgi:hypothetical protein
MSTNLERRAIVLTICAATLATSACTKEEPKPAAPVAVVAPEVDTVTLIRNVGAEPGPVQRSEGALAMIAESSGALEVRRLGQETFAAIRNGALFHGDQLRTGEGARATILFADTTTAELTESSRLAIGSRSASADPASSAAVLSGVVRFSTAGRVAGEGPFVVFAPTGLVATKGTVFAVGVAASGAARVGVESGEVSVAGLQKPEAAVALSGGHSVDLTATGALHAEASWPKDDWGAWRDGSDEELDVGAAATLHGNALAKLEGELAQAYEQLRAIAARAATFEATVSAAATADDSAKYAAALPAGSADITASFAVALRLEWLTHAYVAHAALLSELYIRHPDALRWPNYASRVDAAVLWPKRYEAALVAVLEPMRLAYYVHHEKGRAHARFVGVTVPAFHAQIAPPAGPEPKLAFMPFVLPRPVATSDAHGLWIAAPPAGWHTQVRARPAVARGEIAFWMRPAKLKSSLLLGASARSELPTRFEVKQPTPRAELKGAWSVELGRTLELDVNLGSARLARSAFIHGEVLPDAEIAAHVDAHAEAPALEGAVEMDKKLRAKVRKGKKRVESAAKLGGELRADVESTGKQLRTRAAEGAAKLEADVRPPKLSGEVRGEASLSLGL